MATMTFHHRNGLADIGKRKSFGLIIEAVFFRLGAVHGNTYRVQTGMSKPVHRFREATVGVEINCTPRGMATHQADAFFHGFGLQEWFTLATLAEADNGTGCHLQVIDGDFGNFLRCGYKGNPVLGGGTATRRLQ